MGRWSKLPTMRLAAVVIIASYSVETVFASLRRCAWLARSHSMVACCRLIAASPSMASASALALMSEYLAVSRAMVSLASYDETD